MGLERLSQDFYIYKLMTDMRLEDLERDSHPPRQFVRPEELLILFERLEKRIKKLEKKCHVLYSKAFPRKQARRNKTKR